MKYHGRLTTSIFAYPNNRIAILTDNLDFAVLCRETKIIELGYPSGTPNYKGVFDVLEVIDNRNKIKEPKFPKGFIIIANTKFNYDSFLMDKIDLYAIPYSNNKIEGSGITNKPNTTYLGNKPIMINQYYLAKDSNEIAISTYDNEWKEYNQIQTNDIPILKNRIKDYLRKEYQSKGVKIIASVETKINNDAEQIIETEFKNYKASDSLGNIKRYINELSAKYDVNKLQAPTITPDLNVSTQNNTSVKSSNNNVSTLPKQDTNKITKTPFYKKKWFMIGVPIGVVGLAIASYFMFRSK